jgi:hypothetical protein
MNWKELVGSVAPVLGTALAGPFGGMAGKFLADKLGVDESELDDIVTTADPEKMLQIKNSEHEFKIKLKELGIKEKQLDVEDRQDARKMATSTTLLPQIILSVVFVTGFIFVLYLVFKGEVDLTGTMKDIAIFLLGILSAGITQILNFFFGSSSGSKEKTLQLGKK